MLCLNDGYAIVLVCPTNRAVSKKKHVSDSLVSNSSE